SHRNPMASERAVVRGTPRTARLATASSHSSRVRIVDAANTTAYCWRNLGLVKSTLAVSWTAALSCLIVQEAASAQPWAREARGSRAEVGESRRLAPPPPSPSRPRSQYFLAGPAISEQGSSLSDGVGLGVGAADAREASRTADAWKAATKPVALSTRWRLPGIGEPSVLLDGLADLVGSRDRVVSGDGSGAGLLAGLENLPVVPAPVQLQGHGEPTAGHRVGRLLSGEAEQALAPDLDGGRVVRVGGQLGAHGGRAVDGRAARWGPALLGASERRRGLRGVVRVEAVLEGVRRGRIGDRLHDLVPTGRMEHVVRTES